MLQIENTVLVVIDVQGRLAQVMYDKAQLFENLQKIIKGAKVLKLPIIWVEQIPEKLGATISEVSELLKDITPIKKKSFSCCGNNEFSNTIAKLSRSDFLLTGIETHVCVYQTAADLLKLGCKVHAVVDAVSSRNIENKGVGLEKIKTAGGDLTTVETVLFELLKTAEHSNFLDIINIVK